MLIALLVLALLLFIYMGGSQMGQARNKRMRVLEMQVNVLSAKKTQLDMSVMQAEQDLAQNLEENKTRVEEDLLKAKRSMNEEIDRIKKQKLEEVEREAAAEKMSAVNKLGQWVDQEKARLQKRLDEEYDRKLDELDKLE